MNIKVVNCLSIQTIWFGGGLKPFCLVNTAGSLMLGIAILGTYFCLPECPFIGLGCQNYSVEWFLASQFYFTRKLPLFQYVTSSSWKTFSVFFTSPHLKSSHNFILDQNIKYLLYIFLNNLDDRKRTMTLTLSTCADSSTDNKTDRN